MNATTTTTAERERAAERVRATKILMASRILDALKPTHLMQGDPLTFITHADKDMVGFVMPGRSPEWFVSWSSAHNAAAQELLDDFCKAHDVQIDDTGDPVTDNMLSVLAGEMEIKFD
jgi:hypothetical protein